MVRCSIADRDSEQVIAPVGHIVASLLPHRAPSFSRCFRHVNRGQTNRGDTIVFIPELR